MRWGRLCVPEIVCGYLLCRLGVGLQDSSCQLSETSLELAPSPMIGSPVSFHQQA